MTSWLDDKEIEMFRSFKKTAIVLMLLMRLDRPMGEAEIADLLDMSPKTVRSYLRSLADSCLVARTRRYHGWTLTAGGRQLVLGEARPPLLAQSVPLEQREEAGGIRTDSSNVNSRSSGKNCRSSEANRGSQSLSAAECGASGKNSLSSGKNCRPSVKNYRSSGKNCRSRPIAAASLSLSFKEERNKAAAARGEVSIKNRRSNGKNPRSSDRISRSLSGRRIYWAKNGDKAVGEMQQCHSRLQENLEAFASIGVMKNKHILEICKMKHVNPGYILGQKKRLESERRYSPGLLLTVIRCNDYLPEKYLPCKDWYAQPDIPETEPEPEEEAEPIAEIEPDASVHEALSENGMTAMKAWSAALRQLKADMPKATYDQWVRDSMLLAAQDGTFVIGAPNDYAREWLESRLTSTIVRLLTGICNQRVEARFVNINDLNGVRY